jgi:hypothetical protein
MEVVDSGQIRLQKIEHLIENCKYGIHDLSNMELDPDNGLPRFNMPLELGLFLGAKRYGDQRHKDKKLIILDSEKYRYQKAISDISGQDIKCHRGNPAEAIKCIREWLQTASQRKTIPSGKHITQRYHQYEADLEGICERIKFDIDELTYNDLLETMSEWQAANAEN